MITITFKRTLIRRNAKNIAEYNARIEAKRARIASLEEEVNALENLKQMTLDLLKANGINNPKDEVDEYLQSIETKEEDTDELETL